MKDINLQSARRCVSVFCCVALLLLITKINAQIAGTGQIQGTVTDQTRSICSECGRHADRSSDHSEARDPKTDGAGIYVFPNMPIATYNLIVTAQGFKTYEQTGIVLEVGSNIAINPKLAVGKTDVTVEVHSDNLALQTEDATYKQTIDSTQVVEMPLNGRRMTDLLYISGGTTPASGNDFTGSKYSYAAIAISVAGGMGNSTLWRLDGADNGDYMSGANLPFPFPDAVSEFSVEASTLGARIGCTGGMVNVSGNVFVVVVFKKKKKFVQRIACPEASFMFAIHHPHIPKHMAYTKSRKSRPMPECSIAVRALSGRDMTTIRSVNRRWTPHRVDTARRRRKSCFHRCAGADLSWTKARTETRLPRLETG